MQITIVLLISIIELHLDSTRDPQQYRTVFERMYGKEAVQQAWANSNSPNAK